MLTRPPDLTDQLVSEALHGGWGIDAVQVEYRPVGFGSHHWVASTADGARWFVTVDFGPTGLLDAALSVARQLADSGMRGVVAPRPQPDGELLHQAWTDRSFVVSLFPYVDAPTLEEVGATDHTAVLELLADLHSRTDAVRELAPSDLLAVPGRAELLARLGDLATPWMSGPYGESVRDLLLPNIATVGAALTRFDGLARDAGSSAWVITHGEPHDRNILSTVDGPALIDWDTARIAPAARDIWHVGDGSLAPEYTALTGRAIAPSELALYRLRWDLTEVAECVAAFAAPHVESADSAEALESLREALEGLHYDA